MPGPIEDKHRGKKDRRKDDPLSGEIGNRDTNTNDVDYNEKTIRDQKNKK